MTFSQRLMIWKPLMVRYTGVVLLLHLCSSLVSMAGDAASDFSDFQNALKSARVRSSSRPSISNQAEADQFLERVASAALEVVKRAKRFIDQHPDDAHVAEVNQELGGLLFNVFGTGRFPLPQAGIEEVERFAEAMLKDTPGDLRMNFVLYRVAGALPSSRQSALYERLAGEPVPPPVRDLAQKTLRKLDRLNKRLDLNFTALDGRTVAMSNYLGKVVVIDFWATWCGPCVRELPALKKLYAEQQPHGLEIIGISLDSDRESLARFLNKEQIAWPQFFETTGQSNRIAKAFEIESIPVAWLVDRKGNLRELNARSGLESQVQELLATDGHR